MEIDGIYEKSLFNNDVQNREKSEKFYLSPFEAAIKSTTYYANW